MRSSIVLALSVLAVACTGQQQPPPVRSVAQPTTAPAPYRAAAAPAPAPSPAADWQHVPSGGPIAWLSSLAEAQAQARAQGKLILVTSTKPGCSLCDKFAHQTAPACSGDLNRMAVAYIYNILSPEDGRVDRTLRNNLPGAAVMPLVGFLTPDLQWVTGFWGPRSVSEFMGDIANARRIYPVTAAALPRAPVGGPATAFVNEYGETEWSAPADVWPAPKDALAGVSAVAAAPAVAVEPAPAVTEPVAAVTSEPLAPQAPSAEPVAAEPVAAEPIAAEPIAAGPVAAGPVADVPAPTAVEPAPLPAWSPAPRALSSGVAASTGPTSVAAAVSSQREEQPPLPVAAAGVAPAPAAVVAVAGPLSETEAQGELRRAFALIQTGRYDEARASLKLVSKALPGSTLGREADRGSVALYNARRIAEADADRRSELVERARRDLGTSMWVTLF